MQISVIGKEPDSEALQPVAVVES